MSIRAFNTLKECASRHLNMTFHEHHRAATDFNPITIETTIKVAATA